MYQKSNSRTTAPLCLACSSSLPPRLWKRATQQQGGAQSPSLSIPQVSPPSSSASTSVSDSELLLFLTRCCGRPICPSCLTSNPRLARYDPCLACLGGVGAVGTKKLQGQHAMASSNVDGAVRDEDVFVVGDEDEDGASASETDDGEVAKSSGSVASSPLEGTAPPPEPDKRDESTEPTGGNHQDQGDSPSRHYIRPDDTILGISLRLGVDGRTLCKMNGLPPSTLRTTPHLLHTRTFLVLPQSHSQQQQQEQQATMTMNNISSEEEARRTRVHAQVSLQQVTKEGDDGIAQAYVALAEDGDSEPDLASSSLKAEGEWEKGSRRVGPRRVTLEERALDRYLDDDEWERRERAEGRGVHIQRFPIRGPQVSNGRQKVG